MFKTVDEAVAALNERGWTEIDNNRAATFASRGGTLVVLTSEPAAGWANRTYSATAVVFSPATDEQVAEWEKNHGPVAEGASLSLMYGAVTGRLLPYPAVVRSNGSPRVWWSPVPLAEQVGEDQDEVPADTDDEQATPSTPPAPSPADMPKTRPVGAAAADDQQRAVLRDLTREMHDVLEAFMAAGFSRDEAYGMAREAWRGYLAHTTAHCVHGEEDDK